MFCEKPGQKLTIARSPLFATKRMGGEGNFGGNDVGAMSYDQSTEMLAFSTHQTNASFMTQ